MSKKEEQLLHEYTIETMTDAQTASIGSELIINDNLDTDIDFNSPQVPFGFATKIIGQNTMFLCVEGEVELQSNTVPYVMHAGDANYAQSGHIGLVKRFSPDTKFLLVACADSFFMPPLSAAESAAFRRELSIHPIAHLPRPQEVGCEILYKMIRNAIYKRDEVHYVRRTVQGLIQAMFFQIMSAYASQSPDDSQYSNARQEEIYQRFIKLVEKNYTQERNIGFYADKLCITPKYLSQLIFKASGIYAGDHIDNYVIAEAKMLIKSRKYTIAQVSDMLNFTSQAYFGRYFKKHTGFTPMEFAEKG